MQEKKTNNNFPKYWTNKEFMLLEEATSFKELTVIARLVLNRMKASGKAIVQVCGPVSNGGKGSIDANLKEFEKAITFLRHCGLTVFDQIPFEKPRQRIKATMDKDKAHRLIMDDFYLPLIQEGFVERYFFLHDYKTSKGAIIEYKRAEKYNIAIDVLPENYEEHYKC